MPEELTYRQLWRRIMYYGEFDRMPVIHWGTWIETSRRWEQEGMPPDLDRPGQTRYFNAVPLFSMIGPEINLSPGFPEEIIETTDEYEILRDWTGVVLKRWKGRGSVPHFIDWTFKTARDWPPYKERLQPAAARIPADFDKRLADAEASGNPICVATGSMMGWLRNWMGVENMCYMAYDDGDCFADVVNTISDLVCWAIDQTVPRMKTRPDFGFGWEDIAGSTGPFVSPDLFDKYVAPGYRKIRAKLEQYGIDIYGIDSDGKVEPLIGHWLDCGVNLQFPLEPGTWKCYPEDMRKKFGKRLLFQGGFDKLVLEKGRRAIDSEIKRHIPLMKEGGFLMMPDHIITPGVPLADYKYYLDRMRKLRF